MSEIHKVKMSNRGKKIYLPTTTYKDYFKENFIILYPRGTEESPGLISFKEEFDVPNPFPGYYINIIPEVLYADEWANPGWSSWGYSNYNSAGIRAQQFKGKIRVTSGTDCILEKTTYKFTIQGYPWDQVTDEVEYNIPFRLKIWKIGVMD